MVTFLVAGHETTSGTLSFLFYHLLKNPEKLQKAQQEVDQILGVRTSEVAVTLTIKLIDRLCLDASFLHGHRNANIFVLGFTYRGQAFITVQIHRRVY